MKCLPLTNMDSDILTRYLSKVSLNCYLLITLIFRLKCMLIFAEIMMRLLVHTVLSLLIASSFLITQTAARRRHSSLSKLYHFCFFICKFKIGLY